MIPPYILMIVAAFIGSIGQILFSMSSKYFTLNIMDYINKPGLLVQMIPFGIAVVLYAGATIISIIAYKNGQVSKLFPIAALTYIFTIILASIFLGESITVAKIIGGLVIIAGVAIISFM